VLEDGWNKFSIFAKSAAEKIKQGSSELTQKVSEKNWSQDVSQFSTKIVESSEKGWSYVQNYWTKITNSILESNSSSQKIIENDTKEQEQSSSTNQENIPKSYGSTNLTHFPKEENISKYYDSTNLFPKEEIPKIKTSQKKLSKNYKQPELSPDDGWDNWDNE
jgi:hypothetical protein